MILDDIVEVKRREVAARKIKTPLSVLTAAIKGMPPTRDFRRALGNGDCAIIAEVKRRSPSRGIIREDFDPVRIAGEYEQHGAAAVSVLTDETFFGGNNKDLTAVKSAISLPVLRKEFIIDSWQIHETRAIGADALLLIAAILEANQLREYRELAASLGLASLVEVHNRTELEAALCAGAEIIGINNRDLKTFSTDIGTSLTLAPLVPTDRIVVSESGIRSRNEIKVLRQAGVRTFLIGEALVAAPDRGMKMRELLGQMKATYTEIKICGITRLEDALCAATCGADAVGFIFHKESPRYIAPERAKAIIAQLPRELAKVGVFVNCKTEEVERIVEGCDIDLIQLHGDESPAYCRLFPPERVIKAVSPKSPEELRALDVYDVRAFLIDARDAGRYGGTGKRADWNLAAALKKTLPLILAGGLDMENIQAALTAVAPRAVDINSGCELAPGIKDHDRMRRIIGLIRGMTQGRIQVMTQGTARETIHGTIHGTVHGAAQGTIHSGGAPGPKAIFVNFVKK